MPEQLDNQQRCVVRVESFPTAAAAPINHSSTAPVMKWCSSMTRRTNSQTPKVPVSTRTTLISPSESAGQTAIRF